MEFPGNSQKARVANEPKNIERVTSAEAVRRKRGVGRRFKEIFFSGEDARSVMEYVVVDIVVPELKELIVDAAQSGIERMIHGESSRRPRRTPTVNGYSPHIPYNRISTSTPSSSLRTTQQPSRMLSSRRPRIRHEFEDLIIPSRQEAEEVIDRMFDILSRYGQVSLDDLHVLVGIKPSHTDMKWGWYELRGAKAVRLRQGGFLLDLPEPQPLD